MAKRRAKTEDQLKQEQAQIVGVSTKSLDEAEVNTKALLEGFNNSELRIPLIINSEKVWFKLVEIDNDRILKDTIVALENEREQKFINPLSVSSITSQIEKCGQTYPAIGRIGKDNKIEILDGSQRRMGCYYSGKSFFIYVSETYIQSSVAKSVSNTTNTHKPLSLLERGIVWAEQLENKVYKNQAQLVVEEGVNKDLVSAALKAALLPSWLVDIIPSPTDLGRPSILKLYRLIDGLSPKELSELKIKCSDLKCTTNELINSPADYTADLANKMVVTKILKVASESEPKKKTEQFSKLKDGSNGKATLIDGKLNISINEVSEAMLAKLEVLLEEYGLGITK